MGVEEVLEWKQAVDRENKIIFKTTLCIGYKISGRRLKFDLLLILTISREASRTWISEKKAKLYLMHIETELFTLQHLLLW